MSSVAARCRYIVSFVVVFVAALGVAAFINLRSDPAHLFDDGQHVAAAAKLMAEGKNVVAANLDERLLQRHYVGALSPGMGPDTLVLGSSRVMQIDSNMLPEGRTYNAGVSTVTLYDLLGLTELFLALPNPPVRIVIGVDPGLFDATARNERWQTLGPEIARMLRKMDRPERLAAPSSNWEALQSLISIAYLERSLERIGGNLGELFENPAEAAPVTVELRTGRAAIRRADGSLGYDAAYRERGLAEIAAAAAAHGRKYVTGALRFDALDGGRLDLFDDYLAYVRAQSVEIIIMLAPFHPAVVSYVRAHDPTHSLERISKRMRELAARRGLRVIGDYDPQVVGCAEADFYDGTHAKPSCLERITRALDAEGNA